MTVQDTYYTFFQGYIFWPARKIPPPPPLKFFPVFVDFWGVFKLHKGILTCVLSLFSLFSSFPPFSFPFFKSSFKFFPVFHFGQKISPPPPLPRMVRIYKNAKNAMHWKIEPIAFDYWIWLEITFMCFYVYSRMFQNSLTRRFSNALSNVVSFLILFRAL